MKWDFTATAPAGLAEDIRPATWTDLQMVDEADRENLLSRQP
ncbi:hypothetical protein SBV1_3480013 [Verrucomicrobia bacterium]|nr:hypothetical protein SBV1_3480013 [Verrucomicrobiota bacterium]